MVERKGKLHGFIEFVFVSKFNNLVKKKYNNLSSQAMVFLMVGNSEVWHKVTATCSSLRILIDVQICGSPIKTQQLLLMRMKFSWGKGAHTGTTIAFQLIDNGENNISIHSLTKPELTY